MSRAGGLDLESLEGFASYDSPGPPRDTTSKSGIILALIAEVRALRTALRPGDDEIEAIRQDETVRDAFVECYTLNGIVSEEGNTTHWLPQWDRVESALIRAILVRVGAPERDL